MSMIWLCLFIWDFIISLAVIFDICYLILFTAYLPYKSANGIYKCELCMLSCDMNVCNHLVYVYCYLFFLWCFLLLQIRKTLLSCYWLLVPTLMHRVPVVALHWWGQSRVHKNQSWNCCLDMGEYLNNSFLKDNHTIICTTHCYVYVHLCEGTYHSKTKGSVYLLKDFCVGVKGTQKWNITWLAPPLK